MRLRNTLFALVSGVVVITVVLVTVTVSTAARRSFAELDSQRTASLVAQFRREFANQQEQVARSLERVAASDVALRAAALSAVTHDYAAYVNEAGPLAAAHGLDFLDVVTDDGTIMSSAHWPARFGYRHPWAAEQRAMDVSRGFLQIVERQDESVLGLAAIREIPSGDRRVYLAGGRWLDRQFLQSLVLPPGMRVLLYRNLEPEVSRRQLIGTSHDTPDGAQLEPLIARVRDSAAEATEAVQWPDGPEAVHAIPLAGTDERVLGVLLIGSSGRELAALVQRIRWSGIAFGGLGITVGFLLSYLVAAKVTRPVEEVSAAAHAVADGDWDVRLDHVAASGEIKTLARAFDTMTMQLADHRERLVQAERVAAWRELARRLAHELKNPLFPLRITIDNLRRAKSLPPSDFDEVFDESMTTLAMGLGNLNTVVGRFSDFARMPAPEFTDVSANDIVRNALALFRAQLEPAGGPAVGVSVDLDPSLPTIRADAEQLGRVVQNLLLNAIDAMPEGGRLTLRTRHDGHTVRLDVSDTGHGLAAEERDRLFTPYYTTKRHGTGLGLAIVQSVVADHEGKISVESAPGRGTTFHVELPAAGPRRSST